MKTNNNIEKFANQFVNLISKRINEMQLNWEKPWFSVSKNTSFLPQNLRGNIYRSGNAFFLYMLCEEEKFKTPIFLTFKQAQDNALNILKGSKSFPITYKLYSAYHKVTKEKITWEEYKKLSEEEKKEYRIYTTQRFYLVFNLDQTNYSEVEPDKWEQLLEKFKVKEIQEPTAGFNNKYIEPMLLQKTWLCNINLENSDRAFYTSSGDAITLPLKAQFKSDEYFYSTLLHEMAHSTGHTSRLNRQLGNRFGSEDYAREELIAELSAALTGIFTGVSSGIREENAAYLQSWLKKFKSDVNYLFDVINDAVKASNLICSTIGVEVEENIEVEEKVA